MRSQLPHQELEKLMLEFELLQAKLRGVSRRDLIERQRLLDPNNDGTRLLLARVGRSSLGGAHRIQTPPAAQRRQSLFLSPEQLYDLRRRAGQTLTGIVGQHEVRQGNDGTRKRTVPAASNVPRVYRPPGFKLLALADFWFSRRTYTEILEPTLRDLQDEHIEALAVGRFGKARWVALRGYCSFWSAVIALAPVSLIKRLTELWKALP